MTTKTTTETLRNDFIASAQDAYHYLAALSGEESSFDEPRTLKEKLEMYDRAHTKLVHMLDVAFGIESRGVNFIDSKAENFIMNRMPGADAIESVGAMSNYSRGALKALKAWCFLVLVDARQGCIAGDR